MKEKKEEQEINWQEELKSIEKRFNNFKQQEQNLINQLDAIKAELLQLKGEYRYVEGRINKEKKEVKNG